MKSYVVLILANTTVLDSVCQNRHSISQSITFRIFLLINDGHVFVHKEINP